MARATRGKLTNSNVDDELPLWSIKMMEKYDACAERLEKAILSSFTRIFNKINEINEGQKEIFARISDLEKRLATISSPPVDRNLLYSTMVKVKSDEKKIGDKLKRIAWIGIGEQHNEESTRKFDSEALKEVVETSGDEELISEFTKGNIRAHRHPPGQPRGTQGRGRLIKIDLPSQELKERLLRHMRSGRQSLTKEYVHSYARCDYTEEQLELDRSLRRQAGELNARAGKLQYVVRDLQIHKLRLARNLPSYTADSSAASLGAESFQPSPITGERPSSSRAGIPASL